MEKLKKFIKQFKKNMLTIIVVWLIMVILLVAPITKCVTDAHLAGIAPVDGIMQNIVDNIIKFPILTAFSNTYSADFINGIKYFSIIYFLIVFWAIYKNLPKGGFHDIEHGSSDWCKDGEQYKVLSKKEGLILAKEHYLPLDKSGNINVLIVGRFWLW